MRELRSCVRWVVVLMGSIMTLSGCTHAAMHKLSLDEQAEFHLYYYSGNRVDVSLVAGQVTGWVDHIPSDIPRNRSMP